ncbi:MAG: hypothetical protein KDA62_02375 [Planctomycetales bacterium]|nr:hypothetical protein [Planctomycetales bacterium]
MNSAATLALLASLFVNQTTTTEAPNETKIEQAIQQLSDRDFATRQAATVLLWEAGKDAAAALERAAGSSDREVAYRVRQILDKFKYGIFADTPPEVVRLINQYRDGDINIRREVLSQLQQRDALETVMTLLEAEPNEEFRQQLTTQLLRDVEKVVPRLILEQQYDRVQQLLRLGANTDDGMALYTTYLLLRKEAEPRIAELQRRADRNELEPRDAKLLAHLLRATGQLSAAKEAAETAGLDGLRKSVLFDLGEWSELSRIEDDPAAIAALSTYALIERLGFVAAYYRLAGNEAKFAATIDRMRELSDNDALRWHVAEALIINGRFDDGQQLMSKANESTAFRLLMAQARYREAFALIGLANTQADRSVWLEQMIKDVQSTDKPKRDRFEAGLQAARALARVGLSDEAQRFFRDLGDAVKEDEDGHKQRLRSLIGVESKSGQRDLALSHAAFALAQTANTYALSAAYPEHYQPASLWWEFLTHEFKSEQRTDTLARIDRLIYARGGKMPNEELDALADAGKRFGETLDNDKRAKWLYEIADTYLRHGHAELGEQRLREAAELSNEAAVKLGDLAAERDEWPAARDWYGKAWDRDKTQFLAFYLQGQMMRKTGDDAAGQRQCETAELLPLSQQSRRTFAQGLQDRGYKDDAIRNWQVLVRTGDMHNWYTNDAAKQIGNLVSKQDPSRAVDGWRRLLLSALKTSSSFTEAEGYLQLPQLIHKVQARTLLAAGKNEAALAELKLAHAALPGGIQLAEDLFHQFDAAGMREAIDPLFNQTYSLYVELCEDYPETASHHNNLAWLAARCDRQLDAALTHAEQAVKLAPESMAYLDTLAEVHFRRGDTSQAIELAEKCLAAEPNNTHFQTQLKRFRGEPVEEAESE